MKADSNTAQTAKEPAAAKEKATATGAAGTPKMQESSPAQPTDKGPLQTFFVDSLRDIYWAEQALTKTLPKMKAAATTEELQDAFEDHELQTRKHVSRLEKVFTLLGLKAEAKQCDAMAGLIKEGEHIIASTPEGSMTRDAALIIAAQKVEHYEIASYGGLVQLALTLNHDDAAHILDKTLMEEEETDALLTEIAESSINFEAGAESEEDVADIAEED